MNLNDTIEIHFYDIKWDINEKCKELPPTNFNQVFTGYDLTNHFGKRDPETGEFFVNNEELDEFLDKWLFDKFKIYNNGFHWSTIS